MPDPKDVVGARGNALNTLLFRLHRHLGDRVSKDVQHLANVSGDESGLPKGQAGGVVWPLSTAEVSFIAKEASELGVALVPRGAGTGKAGGAIPLGGDLVVDFSRMNRLKELKERDLYVVVEPGLVTAHLNEAALEHALFYPPDPASADSCTLGGNVATNAGGARALKYGCTNRYVWGLTIVCMGGDVITMGKHSPKGVAGYDVTSLVVGSEGTLGLITEMTLHLLPAPPAVETAWLSFDSVIAASQAAEHFFAAGYLPRLIELLDAPSLAAVRSKAPFRFPESQAALLLECDGREEVALGDLTAMCELALSHGARDALVATNEHECAAMRRTRTLVSSCLKENFPYKLSDDLTVPRSAIPELLQLAQSYAQQAGIVSAAYGHLGDGNVHLNFLCNDNNERLRAQSLRYALAKDVVTRFGTITGEHGIGLAKRDLLSIEQQEELIVLQQHLKRVFDPQNLLNPHKALP